MNTDWKKVSSLAPEDFEQHSVWRFNIDQEFLGETNLSPVADLPVIDLANCVVGTWAGLANGDKIFSLIGNIDLNDLKRTRQFLSMSVFKDGIWFHLSRYFDPDYKRNGPQALADFLGLKVDQVFPIRYDIRHICEGNPKVIVGQVDKEPTEKLTREEIIALSIRGLSLS